MHEPAVHHAPGWLTGAATLGGVFSFLSLLLVTNLLTDERRAQYNDILRDLRDAMEASEWPRMLILHRWSTLFAELLKALYGTTFGRRAFTSFVLTAVYLSVTASIVAVSLRHELEESARAKSAFERSVDPVLAEASSADLDEAFKSHCRGRECLIEYDHETDRFAELRTRVDNFDERLRSALRDRSDRTAMALLIMVHGTYRDPGVSWSQVTAMLGLHAILDLIALVIVLRLLNETRAARSGRKAFVILVIGVGAGLAIYLAALLPYVQITRGDSGAFTLFLFKIPTAVVLAGVGALACVTSATRRGDSPKDRLGSFVTGAALLIGGLVFLHSLRSRLQFEFPPLRLASAANWGPYTLACCASAPLIVFIATIAIATIAKFGGMAFLRPIVWAFNVWRDKKNGYLYAICAAPGALPAAAYIVWEYAATHLSSLGVVHRLWR